MGAVAWVYSRLHARLYRVQRKLLLDQPRPVTGIRTTYRDSCRDYATEARSSKGAVAPDPIFHFLGRGAEDQGGRHDRIRHLCVVCIPGARVVARSHHIHLV